MDASACDMLDLAFSLQGRWQGADPRQALCEALCQALPWLAQEPNAGVHALRLAPQGHLSARSRLVLRLPRARSTDAQMLGGRTLLLQAQQLLVGDAQPRELLPHNTLYAHAVAWSGNDEAAFLDWAQLQLQAMSVHATLICGRHTQVGTSEGAIEACSLMLHGLSAPDALRVLRYGLGPLRLLGCGLFVPHRSAAAVGAIGP